VRQQQAWWIATSNAANLAVAPEAAAIGIEVPREIAALVACEWRGWGRVFILIAIRDVRGRLTGEHDLYWDTVDERTAAVAEAALLGLAGVV
jgi:hypothetical protein